MNFHTLQVSNIKKLTADSKEITFQIPTEFSNNYTFKPGQYVTIQVELNGKKENRSYSICSSSSLRDTISIGVKQIENGLVSTYLNQSVSEGDRMNVSTPDGQFYIDSIESSIKNYVFFAGGSGITPIMSMLQYVLEKSNATIYLFYSNKNMTQTMFHSELDALNNSNSRLNIKFINTQAGDSRIDETTALQLISTINGYNESQYYVCGPNGIINSVEHSIKKLLISEQNYHREYFTAKDASDMEATSIGGAATDVPLSKGEKAQVEIKYEGRKYQFECKYDEKILDAALDSGAEPPYSCMVAACCTCRAQVKSGQVEMLDKDALSKKDIEKNFVLTCQSVPRSKHIYLDFDE